MSARGCAEQIQTDFALHAGGPMVVELKWDREPSPVSFGGYMGKLSFGSDYMRGAHPNILRKLTETNLLATGGYGLDPYCEDAREKIRQVCRCPEAQVQFLVGGTQTNATVIDALLRTYQGVLAAGTGHISVHEAGAIEAGGHKVLTLPQELGKIRAESVREYMESFYGDESHEHMVMPGMVYISQPTEYGTLYSRQELEELHKVCREYDLPLYLDGARLAYALASPANDASLPDLAALCDVFYIGGTKCGALFGEAVVVPDPGRISGFFTIIKQHGALLAKGRLLGIQFGELFDNGLYLRIGAPAIHSAARIQAALEEKGYPLLFRSPTNQIFCVVDKEKLRQLSQIVEFSVWEKKDEDHSVIRLATDWASTDEEADALIGVL